MGVRTERGEEGEGKEKTERERGCRFNLGRGRRFKRQSLHFQKGPSTLSTAPRGDGAWTPASYMFLLPVCPSSGDRCWPEGAGVTAERREAVAARRPPPWKERTGGGGRRGQERAGTKRREAVPEHGCRGPRVRKQTYQTGRC